MSLDAPKIHLVALKRQFRDHPPVNLREVLESTPGVRLLGITGSRAQIEASPQSVTALSAKLGDSCWIEESLERK